MDNLSEWKGRRRSFIRGRWSTLFRVVSITIASVIIITSNMAVRMSSLWLLSDDMDMILVLGWRWFLILSEDVGGCRSSSSSSSMKIGIAIPIFVGRRGWGWNNLW